MQSSLPAWSPQRQSYLSGLKTGGLPWLFLVSLAFFSHCSRSLASLPDHLENHLIQVGPLGFPLAAAFTVQPHCLTTMRTILSKYSIFVFPLGLHSAFLMSLTFELSFALFKWQILLVWYCILIYILHCFFLVLSEYSHWLDRSTGSIYLQSKRNLTNNCMDLCKKNIYLFI